MEKLGTLNRQLSRPGIQPYGIEYSGGLTAYPGCIRIVSLQRASTGKKYALAAISKNTIIAQKITNASTVNDKWQMIIWRNSSTDRFLYNIEFGLYLARKNGKLVLVDVSKLPYVNNLGDIVNVNPSLCCRWSGLSGGRHIYLTDDPKSQSLSKDINTGYCVKGSGTDITVDTSKTCNLQWKPGSTVPNCNVDDDQKVDCGKTNKQDCNDSGCCWDDTVDPDKAPFCYNRSSSGCEDGYSCRYITEKQFCDQQGFFQPDSLAISIEASPGIGTPITGEIYLNINKDNSVNVVSIPEDIKSEMVCTGTYVTGKNRATPNICWSVLTQESPENVKNTVPSRTGWSVSQLLSWDPKEDGVLEYGRSLEPLAKRFVNQDLQILPEKPYPPYFTYSTSSPDAVGCPTQYMSGTLLGPGRFAYMWNWQYVDQYSLFSGDQGSGADPELYKIDAKNMGIGMCDLDAQIPGPCPSGEGCPNGVASVGGILEGVSAGGKGGRFTFPTKYMIDAAHKNGCKIYGCGLFFQEIYYGGQYSWLMQALANPKLLAKKMVDVAVAYGFDGWMTNFETGTTDAGYTWGGEQKPNTAGYSGQIYGGTNYFTGQELTSDYWKNQIQGSSMPAFRMHGGDLCEGCTTCGSGPVGCATSEYTPDSASTCLYVEASGKNSCNVADEQKVDCEKANKDDCTKQGCCWNDTVNPKITPFCYNSVKSSGKGKYSTACSSVYTQGGSWTDLQKNCANLEKDHNCQWVNPAKYNHIDTGKPLVHTLEDGRVCRTAYDAAFPMTCENPASKNLIGALKFSGGDIGEATKWTAKNIVETMEEKKQITNAIGLRQNFRKFLQEFKKYKKKIGAEVNILIYDTEQLTGPLAGGITMPPAGRNCKPHGEGTCYGNLDIWVDDDGTPLADQIYDMNSGEFLDVTGSLGVIPQGITSTYTLSNNNDIVESYQVGQRMNIEGKHYPAKSGWPKNTGPKAPGFKNRGNPTNLNDQTNDCDGGSVNWAPFTDPDKGFCVPQNYEGVYMNNGKRPRDLQLGLRRPYDYYQTIQWEGLDCVPSPSLAPSGDLAGEFAKTLQKVWTQYNDAPTTPDWQQQIYCGIQGTSTKPFLGKCDNDLLAVEYPLSSFLKFDSGSDSLQKVSTTLQDFSDKAIGIDYVDRVTSVGWTGGHLLGKVFRDSSSSTNNFKGFGHVINERFVVQKLPFSTYFSIGTGENYYSQGDLIPFGPWTNWSLQDVSPTWQWRPELCDPIAAQKVRISYDTSDAYQKGNSLLFRYTSNPSSWLRQVLGAKESCSLNGAARTDCLPNYSGSDVKGDCAKANCCYDESADPWCYKKVSQNILSNGDKTQTCTYMLYATNIEAGDIIVSLITKTSGKGRIELGLSKKGDDIMNPVWVADSIKGKVGIWNIETNKIHFTGKIACIWIRVTVENVAGHYLRLGGIQLSRKIKDLQEVYPDGEDYVNRQNIRNSKLIWKPISGIEYYELYEDNKLLGLAYQGSNPRPGLPMVYNLLNLKPQSELLAIGIPEGVSNQRVIQKPVSLTIVVSSIFAIFLCIFLVIFMPKLTKGKSVHLLRIIVTITGVLAVFILFAHLLSRKRKRAAHSYRIEHWKDGKGHALNACFDDARVKCWRWLLYEWHKRNWDIKFTFYYNTLWIARDWDWLQSVIKLGHEIGAHGHDHLTPSDGSIPEKYQADNLEYCAKLLREMYNNPTEQLSYAYPHGALPLLQSKRQSTLQGGSPDANKLCSDSYCHTDSNCTTACVSNKCVGEDGSPISPAKSCKSDTDCNNPNKSRGYQSCQEECEAAGAPKGCRTCGGQGGCNGAVDAPYVVEPFVKALEENFIDARIVTDVAPDEDTYLGISTWPPNGNGNLDTRNTMAKNDQSFFKANGTLNIGLNPIWTWPYQIDLNRAPDDNTTADQITQNYIRQYEICLNNPNSMIILAGHDFNPTDPSTGEDIPCDNNSKVTPIDLQDLACSCCDNPNSTTCPILKDEWNGMIPLYDSETGKFPIIDWSKRPKGIPAVEGGRPSGGCDFQWNEDKSKTCNQACDACWVATPGSSIIKLFDRINKDKDNLWFATFKEIVAYCYNRKNSTLKEISSGKTRLGSTWGIYELSTTFSYDGVLSLSFKSASKVTVKGRSVKIQKTPSGVEYVNIQPIKGTLRIKVIF